MELVPRHFEMFIRREMATHTHCNRIDQIEIEGICQSVDQLASDCRPMLSEIETYDSKSEMPFLMAAPDL